MTSIYQELVKLTENGSPGVLCTIVFSQGSTPRREGSKMLVFPGGNIVGTVGGGELERRVIYDALEALKEGRPKEVEYSMVDPNKGDPGVCGGQLRIFVDPILPPPRLVVLGCGHIGKEVVKLGKWLGYQVVVCDDQPELCNSTNIPDADEYHTENWGILGDNFKITHWTYVVLTTRDLEVDVLVLPKVLASEAAYVGVIGSRRRWSTTTKRLRDLGVDDNQIDRVHSPIGLDLGAETPREIALSILAEIISIQNKE